MATNLKLKALRVGEGLSQKDMCVLLGLKGEGSYSMMENGKRPFKQAHIGAIAQRFSLSGDQIKEIFFNHQLTSKEKEDEPCKLQQPEITADTLPSTGNTE